MPYSVHPPLIAYFKFLLPLISSTVKYLKSGKFDLFKWIGINFDGYMSLEQFFLYKPTDTFCWISLFLDSRKRGNYMIFLFEGIAVIIMYTPKVLYIFEHLKLSLVGIMSYKFGFLIWHCSRTRCSTANYIYQGCLFITTTMVAKNNILAHNRDLTISRYLKTDTTAHGRYHKTICVPYMYHKTVLVMNHG